MEVIGQSLATLTPGKELQDPLNTRGQIPMFSRIKLSQTKIV
jgi:hypothetical protein